VAFIRRNDYNNYTLYLQFTAWVDAVIFVFSLENEASFNAVYGYYTKMAHYRNSAEIPLILVGTQGEYSHLLMSITIQKIYILCQFAHEASRRMQYIIATLRLGVECRSEQEGGFREDRHRIVSFFFDSRRGARRYILYKSVWDKKKMYTIAISLFIKKSS